MLQKKTRSRLRHSEDHQSVKHLAPVSQASKAAFKGANLINNQFVNLANFFSSDINSRGGIPLAVNDLEGDNFAELVGAGAKSGSMVTSFLGKDITANGTPPAALDFDAFSGFTGGVFLGK
ncbi:MAG: hypothetical protein ACRC8S_04670 [Fimbriiglobus sp.]